MIIRALFIIVEKWDQPQSSLTLHTHLPIKGSRRQYMQQHGWISKALYCVKDKALHGTTYEVLEKGKFSKKIQLSLMGWEGA